MNETLRLEYVMDSKSIEAQTFLRLGDPYMAEISPKEEAIDRERFLRSILHRQGEPGRCLHRNAESLIYAGRLYEPSAPLPQNAIKPRVL